MRVYGVALSVVAALAVAATPAGAVTFGADLGAHPANDNPLSTCAQSPPGYFLPQGSSSCMWSFQGIGAGAPTLVAPANGVVSRVRVKVGATTGPMRVNVIRYLFQQTGDVAHPSSAGPFLEAYGPQFTPTANTTASVPANLPMRVDPTPAPTDLQTIQVIDALALEVGSSTVPVPVYQDNASLTYPIYPGPTAQGVPAPSPNALPSYTSFGYGVLLSADLDPTRPTVTLPKTTVPVTGGAAGVPLRCVGADCAGTLTLQRRAGGGRATAARTVSYGSAAFALRAGATGTVRVTLNRAGRALLKTRRSATVTARVTFTKGAGKTRTFAVKLRR